MKKGAFRSHFTNSRQHFLLYVLGSCLVLGLKIGLTAVLVGAGITIWISYLVSHALALVSAYLYHSLVSFKKGVHFNAFINYGLAVAWVKSADYLLVSMAVHVQFLNTTPAIICSSLLIYSVRYLSVRKVFLNQKDPI